MRGGVAAAAVLLAAPAAAGPLCGELLATVERNVSGCYLSKRLTNGYLEERQALPASMCGDVSAQPGQGGGPGALTAADHGEGADSAVPRYLFWTAGSGQAVHSIQILKGGCVRRAAAAGTPPNVTRRAALPAGAGPPLSILTLRAGGPLYLVTAAGLYAAAPGATTFDRLADLSQLRLPSSALFAADPMRRTLYALDAAAGTLHSVALSGRGGAPAAGSAPVRGGAAEWGWMQYIGDVGRLVGAADVGGVRHLLSIDPADPSPIARVVNVTYCPHCPAGPGLPRNGTLTGVSTTTRPLPASKAYFTDSGALYSAYFDTDVLGSIYAEVLVNSQPYPAAGDESPAGDGDFRFFL